MSDNQTPKTGGLMALVMPIYTIGIVVFFLYTILKVIKLKTISLILIEVIEEDSVECILGSFID